MTRISTRRLIRKARTFALTNKRGRILELLAEYYCLRTNEIFELLYYPDRHHVKKTLRALRGAGYLNVFEHWQPSKSESDYGSRVYVHGLTDKAVREYGGKSFDEHSIRTLDHELEISYFHIALKKFCEQHTGELYWQQTDLKRGIHPDALFALTAEKGTYYFFLEIEKSKPGKYINGEPGILRKLVRYAEYYDSNQCETDWNFRKFRVIVVQTNDTRRQNLLKALTVRLNYHMFWLTTEPLYKSGIDGEIFATPRDLANREYSFLSL